MANPTRLLLLAPCLAVAVLSLPSLPAGDDAKKFADKLDADLKRLYVRQATAEWIKKALGDSANFWLLGVIFAVLIGGGVASWLADRRSAGGPTVGGTA